VLKRSFIPAAVFALAVGLPLAATQRDPASASFARLIAAGKLWATIQHFHPHLAWSQIDWEAALIEAIPKIQAAVTREDFIKALQSMLSALNDPATIVTTEDEFNRTGLGISSVVMTPDQILIAGSGAVPRDPLESAGELMKLLPKARGVVIDLTAGALHPWLLNPGTFTSRPLVMPSVRTRVHSGLHPDRGGWASPYFSGTLVRDAPVVMPSTSGRDVPVVFAVRDDRQVPGFASALQDAGHGYIVAAQPLTGSALVTTAAAISSLIPVTEGVMVRMRVAELAHSDGTTGLCADAVDTRPLDAALALARQPVRNHCRRAQLPGPAPARQRVNAALDASPLPPLELRLLGAFRVWGAFQYLFPYRELMNEDWDAVLAQSAAQVASAPDARAYHLAISRMVARVHDTHATVASPTLTAHWGNASPGVALRYIEQKAVVVAVQDTIPDVRVGDVVVEIDGESVETRISALSPYIAASTPQALMRDVMNRLLRGPDGSDVTLGLGALGESLRRTTLRRSTDAQSRLAAARPEMVRILSGNIGYIDLRQITVGEVDGAFEKLRGTRGIIFDMRGYPRDTRVAISRWLAKSPTIASGMIRRRLAVAPLTTTFEELAASVPLSLDSSRHYAGPTAMLIDERAQSQSESTGMMLRAAGGTTFIGTATAGANGDSTAFYVPGGIYVSLTGQGVWHSDGRQLQRVGLVPDIVIAPTIQGIREGRDEVLERAVSHLGGQERRH
jgi:C-terminal processing protease CtpA/Prc